MKDKAKKPSRIELERKILELESQLAHRYTFACKELGKAGIDRMTGSGILLQLHALGGREIINPVVIKDGLSKETIAAIDADLRRSFELALAFKP